MREAGGVARARDHPGPASRRDGSGAVEVLVVESRAEMARIAADAVESLIRSTVRPVLGLATGSSPLPVYAELIERHRKHGLSFAGTTMFLLDEYVGLPRDHPQSFGAFIRRELVRHIDVGPESVHGPDGNAADLTDACSRYESLIAGAGGIGLQLLGIGSNGHIGFNEPVSSLSSRTRLKTITDRTRRDNVRFFGVLEEVPHHVLTQGIGTILEARHIVLIASGASKSPPVARAVEGPVTAMVPASALQLHPHVTVIVDEDAASGLEGADYYRSTYGRKPPWQPI